VSKAKRRQAELPADREKERAELHVEDRVLERPPCVILSTLQDILVCSSCCFRISELFSKWESIVSYLLRADDPSPHTSCPPTRRIRQFCIQCLTTAEGLRCFGRH
jgi:hypothetical protein